MKIDLCKLFGVEEEQHFWMKIKDAKELKKYYIKDNELWHLWICFKSKITDLDLSSVEKIYYDEPYIKLTEQTKLWLKLLKNAGYKLIMLVGGGCLEAIKEANSEWIELGIKTLLQKNYKIDLSFMEEDRIYDISELLGDD